MSTRSGTEGGSEASVCPKYCAKLPVGTYLPFTIPNHAPSTIYNSNCLGSREQATVYGIDDGLGADLSSAKEPAVNTFDGILTSLDTVEF